MNTDLDLFQKRIQRLLCTNINEQYGYLQQGGRVLNYHHEKATPQTAAAIISEVKQLLKAYEPTLPIYGVGVSMFIPANQAGIEVDIIIDTVFNGLPQQLKIGV